jgi:plastocyanin
MSVLPHSIAISLLAGIILSTPVAGCSPTLMDAHPVAPQPAATVDPPSKNPAPEQGTAPKPKTATVKIDQFAFEPASITVRSGTTVEWTNHDDIPHTVVDTKNGFRSQALDTDDVFRHTFQEPGDFRYFCSIHPHMVGEVHVKK